MKISQMLEVFEAGKTVSNVESWKKGSVNINVIMALISGCVAILNMFDCSFCNFQLSNEQVLGISTGIMTIAGIFNAGSTIATTEKIGVSSKLKIETLDEKLAKQLKDLQ